MAINVEQTHTTTGFKDAVILSRHNDPQYAVNIDVGGGGTFTVQGTLSQPNRAGVTPIWFNITNLTALTVDTADKIVNTPLEAVRLNITAVTDTIIFQVMQNT